MRNIKRYIFAINFLFILISAQEEIEFDYSEHSKDIENVKKFSLIASFKRNEYAYLYIYPKNFIDSMNYNKAIYKIYFKQIKNKDSAKDINLNYLNSDYSSIDFNSGLFIKCSDLKYDYALISIISNEICNIRIFYKYENNINFPSYSRFSNFQTNQFILSKGKTESINYNILNGNYLIVLSKTSLRNIEVKVEYEGDNVTNEKLAYLYPNGCSVFLDYDNIDTMKILVTIKNKNNRDEVILLGYMHDIEKEVFPNEIVNGFQIYLEGNKNDLNGLLIPGKSGMIQYFTYQIYNKNLKLFFETTDGVNKGEYTLNEYNSVLPRKIDYNGQISFNYMLAPQRSALNFQYIDYSDIKVAQISLQSLTTGVPKAMIIPSGKSMYHFLPKERDSKKLYYYLRTKTKEKIYVSFESCTSYPDECTFLEKNDNSVEIIQNIGLWYSIPRNDSELQLINIYCDHDCSYDIIMTYEDNEPLFLFPDNNYTKFISESGEDMFALPVFEYFDTSNTNSLFIDLTILSGTADLKLKDSRDGKDIDCKITKIGNKQSCIITRDDFLNGKNNYYKKEIYAYVKQSGNYKAFYNIIYGAGELNTKTLSNNIIYNELLMVPEENKESEYTKTFNFINNGQNSLYISISTKLCQSLVNIDGTSKSAAYNHFETLKSGSHIVKIYLINDGELCTKNIEDKATIFTYDSTQDILFSENTLINTTISSTVSFLHLFKPNEVENSDNSFIIEIEKFDLNELTFSYQLKKISFDGNSKFSEISGHKITSNKNRYISNNLIKEYCGSLSSNDVCSLTMTLEPSTSSKFSLNLYKNSHYSANTLTEKSIISSVNNKNPKYFYIDIDKSMNLELLVNSYGQDLKVNYNVINKKQDEEAILPLATSYNLGSQIIIQKSSFSSCSDFCRLYIGVTSQESNEEDISTSFFISYHYYDEENDSKSSIYLPFNYYVQYTFNDLKEINYYFFNTISNMELTFDLSVIKKKEDDNKTVTAYITGAINSEIKSDSSSSLKVTTIGQIYINIKPSDENEMVTFKLRISSIGELNVIPMVPSYAEKCLKPFCYYLVDDLTLDNEEKSAYFYIPESESSVINYLELKYDKDISITSGYSDSTGTMRKSNWYEYIIPEDRNKILILKIKKEETLYPSYYHYPNQVTLKYGEKRMFTIKRGSKNRLKIKINKETSNNNKYKVTLHSIIGNGIFKTKNKNYYLGLENAYKQDISIIFDNDKKYDMEFEVINQKFDKVDPDKDFVFTIEYIIETGSELKYPITFDKRNSFNFYKSVNFEQFSFYLDRKTITSEDLNMNIKIYSKGNFDIKSYFVDSEFKNATDKNYLDEKIFTFIQVEGFTFSKLEISSDILKGNESPYIYIQISTQKNSGSNIVQIDLYPYNMINTNRILSDELYTQKFPSNTLDYQLLLEKSEINYGNNAIINFILPSEYKNAIAQTSDGKQIIQKDEENLVENSEQKEGFIQKIINLSKEKTLKYLSFNIYLDEKSEKSAPFIITYQNHRFNEEYLYNHYNLSFEIEGKEKSVDYKVIAVRPKYSTSKNILIVKAYDIEKVNKYSNVENEYKSLYLLFNNEIKPDFTFSKELDTDPSLKPLKTITDTSIKAGEYYFIAVSVILDNGREQYLGFKGLSYKVDNSSLWGKISDYMKNHVFTSIIIIIIILFMLGIMVNICRAEKRKPRPTVNIDIQGKMMEDKE